LRNDFTPSVGKLERRQDMDNPNPETIEITKLRHPLHIRLLPARTTSIEECGDPAKCVAKLISGWKYWERSGFTPDGGRPDSASTASENTERDICRHLMHILYSQDARHMVRTLGTGEAGIFLNAVQHVCIFTAFADIFLTAHVIA
jgi:hypothetical protein